MKTLAEAIEEQAEWQRRVGRWVPACGGQEEPMTIRGVRVLYCWNTGTGEHAYLNLDTDIIMTDEEFEALRGG